MGGLKCSEVHTREIAISPHWPTHTARYVASYYPPPINRMAFPFIKAHLGDTDVREITSTSLDLSLRRNSTLNEALRGPDSMMLIEALGMGPGQRAAWALEPTEAPEEVPLSFFRAVPAADDGGPEGGIPASQVFSRCVASRSQASQNVGMSSNMRKRLPSSFGGTSCLSHTRSKRAINRPLCDNGSFMNKETNQAVETHKRASGSP